MNTLKHTGFTLLLYVPFYLTWENSPRTHLVFKYGVSFSQEIENFPNHREQVRIVLHHFASPKVVK